MFLTMHQLTKHIQSSMTELWKSHQD